MIDVKWYECTNCGQNFDQEKMENGRCGDMSPCSIPGAEKVAPDRCPFCTINRVQNPPALVLQLPQSIQA